MPLHPLASRASDAQVALPEDGTANALLNGVWQSDGSRHCLGDRLKSVDVSQGTVTLEAPNGRPTLRVAYFFSGVKRKASIAGFLKAMCVDAKVGLTMHEIDILVGGDEHDLMDKTAQEEWLHEVRGGNFDIDIFSSPVRDLKPRELGERFRSAALQEPHTSLGLGPPAQAGAER
jgi:hypothetical protein